MSKYIDAENLINAIQNKISYYNELNKKNPIFDYVILPLEELLEYVIDIQQEQPYEQTEVELEKEVKSYIKDNFTITDEVAHIPEEDRRYSMWEDDMRAFAKHFFEFGRINARKEE